MNEPNAPRYRDFTAPLGPPPEPPKLLNYPVRRLDEILSADPSDQTAYLSDSKSDYWVKGSHTLLVGCGGVGKSRLVLTWAISDILGKEFCGFTTHGAGKWLILGTETSIFRARADLLRIVAGWKLTDQEKEEVNEKLAMTVFDPETAMPATNLDDLEVVSSLKALSAEHNPDVVVIDPWEAFIRNGDANDAAETRKSFRLLAEIFAKSTLLIVHHAREGKESAKSAFGFDAGGFAKGSKTLTTMARLQINVTPLKSNKDADSEHGLVIACGKSNDTRQFPIRAVKLGEDGVYHEDDDFDPETYLDDVDGKKSKAALTIADIVTSIRGGHTKAGEMMEDVIERTGVAKATFHRVLKKARDKGYISKAQSGHYELCQKSEKIKES